MVKPWYLASETVRGIPITRYIASWYRVDGKCYYEKMKRWLKSLNIDGKPLSDEEIKLIIDCAKNGKLELEETAKRFV